jgi:CheY-like chemotaxis protein
MGKNVLIVDDNPSDMILSSAIIEEHNCAVMTAENGMEALEVLTHNPVDMFVIDLQMPKMGGIELIKRIRLMDRFKKTPIIVMSARGESKDVMLAVQVGADDYAVKPIDHQVFEEKITRYLGNNEGWEEYPVQLLKSDVTGTRVTGFDIISVSEVGMTVQSDVPWDETQLHEVRAKLLEEKGIGTLKARIKEKLKVNGRYQMRLFFVGTNEKTRQGLRLICRDLWQKKQKAG